MALPNTFPNSGVETRPLHIMMNVRDSRNIANIKNPEVVEEICEIINSFTFVKANQMYPDVKFRQIPKPITPADIRSPVAVNHMVYVTVNLPQRVRDAFHINYQQRTIKTDGRRIVSAAITSKFANGLFSMNNYPFDECCKIFVKYHPTITVLMNLGTAKRFGKDLVLDLIRVFGISTLKDVEPRNHAITASFGRKEQTAYALRVLQNPKVGLDLSNKAYFQKWTAFVPKKLETKEKEDYYISECLKIIHRDPNFNEEILNEEQGNNGASGKTNKASNAEVVPVPDMEPTRRAGSELQLQPKKVEIVVNSLLYFVQNAMVGDRHSDPTLSRAEILRNSDWICEELCMFYMSEKCTELDIEAALEILFDVSKPWSSSDMRQLIEVPIKDLPELARFKCLVSGVGLAAKSKSCTVRFATVDRNFPSFEKVKCTEDQTNMTEQSILKQTNQLHTTGPCYHTG